MGGSLFVLRVLFLCVPACLSALFSVLLYQVIAFSTS